MVILVIVTSLLVLALVAVATVGLYVGLLGTFGVAPHVTQCPRCGHHTVAPESPSEDGCSWCRHGHLFHPHHGDEDHPGPFRAHAH